MALMHIQIKIFLNPMRKYCWIKSNPTFNGLKQVLYEPEDRIRISSLMPERKPSYQVIKQVEFLMRTFQQNQYYLMIN